MMSELFTNSASCEAAAQWGAALIVLAYIISFCVEAIKGTLWDRKKGVAFIFRAAGAASVITLLLMPPVKNSFKKERKSTDVIILRDASRSMELQSEAVKNEFKDAARIITDSFKNAPFFKFHQYKFALSTAHDMPENHIRISATALGDALTDVMREHPSSIIFIISDGLSNTGTDPELVSRLAPSYAAKIYPVIPEAPTRAGGNTIRIKEVSTIKKDNGMRLYACKLERKGNASPVKLELFEDGVKIAERESNGQEQYIEFELKEKKRLSGKWHEYFFKVKPLSQGDIPEYKKYGLFKTGSNDGTLLLWRRFDSESRFLKPVLEKRYTPFTMLFLNSFLAKSKSERMNLLENTGLLLLGGIDPASFSESEKKLIAAKMRSMDMKTIWLDPAQTEKWSAERLFHGMFPADAARRIYPVENGKIELNNGKGPSLPVKSLYLPRLRDGVKILAETQTAKGSMPALAGNIHGALFLTEGAWRWKLGRNAPDGGYEIFWDSMLDRVYSGKHGTLTLSENTGENIFADFCELEVVDTSRKSGRSKVDLYMKRPDDGGFKFAGSMKRISDSAFISRKELHENGVYQFYAERKDGTRSNIFMKLADHPSLEDDITGISENTLNSLAKNPDGQAVRKASLYKTLENIKSSSRKYISRRHYGEEKNSRKIYRLMLAAVAVISFAADAFIRRKGGR